jgi:lipooligosaccharide transport system ATP-binding protein
MDGGRIVADGSPRELIDEHVTREVLELRFRVDEQDGAADRLRTSAFANGDARVELLPDRIVVYADDGESALAAVHALSLVPIMALVRRATLEDVFLKLTGHSLVD